MSIFKLNSPFHETTGIENPSDPEAKKENIEINNQTLLMIIDGNLTKEAFEALLEENNYSLNKEILDELVKVDKEELIINHFDKFKNLSEIKSVILSRSFIDKIKHLELEENFMKEIFSHSQELELNLDFSFAKFIESEFPNQLFHYIEEFDLETQEQIKKRIAELHYD